MLLFRIAERIMGIRFGLLEPLFDETGRALAAAGHQYVPGFRSDGIIDVADGQFGLAQKLHVRAGTIFSRKPVVSDFAEIQNNIWPADPERYALRCPAFYA